MLAVAAVRSILAQVVVVAQAVVAQADQMVLLVESVLLDQ
jgi:hypothetical protein